ncbi:early nodulin-like protein 2 [Phoenix dactylifera]|uniref:Early nodulin-like protein 2 n=1 Tax=Phoenix dactylifera TaxID=42345 RepID=A0A8B7D379_PHODC|nr:early nodulin-like protein 2 [Phoenix dactylifera]
METSKSSAGFLLLLGVVIGLVSSSEAYVFYVGGRNGWGLKPTEDYGSWAARNRFQVNDTLVFKYEKGNDSVLVVKKEDYDSCNLTNPIQRLDDGNSVFKFDRSGPFYFISGTGDRCQKGEKLMVVVLAVRNKTPTQPPTSPAPSLSPSPTPSPKPPTSSPAPSPSIPVPSPSTQPPTSPAPSLPPSPTPSPKPPTSSPAPSPSIPVPSPSSSPVPSPSSSTSPSPSSPGSGPGAAPPPPGATPAPSPSENRSTASPSSVLSKVSFGLAALVLGCAFIN